MLVRNKLRPATLALLVLALSIHFATASASPPNHGPPLSISSPSACRLDLDCGPSAFCNRRLSSGAGLCAPRLSENATCFDPTETDDCKPGLFCARDGFEIPPVRRCRRKAGVGGACGFGESAACTTPLVCDSSSGKCRPRRNAGIGGSCESSKDCADSQNHFCDARDGRVCRKRVPFGGKCPSSSIDPFGCKRPSFCRLVPIPGVPNFSDYRCTKQFKAGSICRDDGQCKGSKFETPREDRTVCNTVDGQLGVCAPYTRLLKQIGAPCNRLGDLCDRRRGLYCDWSRHLRKHVCQHRHDRIQSSSFQFCERNSKLSACAYPDKVCRVARSPSGFSRASQFTMCLPRQVVVPPGARCEFEQARCAKESKCRVVPGVARIAPGEFRGGPPALYCVLVRRKGESCGNKFRTQCANGLLCEEGKCAKGGPGEEATKTTHSGFRGVCDSLPCAPDLRCRLDPNFGVKACLLPPADVGAGAVCFPSVVNELKCKTGLQCRADFRGRPFFRCRVRAKVGQFCSVSGECRSGLKCPNRVSPFHPEEQTCFDPDNTVPLGRACDPKKQRYGHRCVSDSGDSPARCLWRGGRFVCTALAGLFEKCCPYSNVVCLNKKLECTKAGICLPRH